jgi:ribosomal-protein-alanine N-acetyltransferase
MLKNKTNNLKKLHLKELKYSDISKEYIKWLNDFETVKFTEQRYKKHTKRDVVNYVKNQKKSKNNFLYGIFLYDEKNNKRHVGNIKLGSIDFNHKNAYISYLIGNKSYLNIGIATWAISKVITIAKKKFKLKKLFAGTYSINYASRKVLKKNNFKCEGTLKLSIEFQKKRYDSMIYGLTLK